MCIEGNRETRDFTHSDPILWGGEETFCEHFWNHSNTERELEMSPVKVLLAGLSVICRSISTKSTPFTRATFSSWALKNKSWLRLTNGPLSITKKRRPCTRKLFVNAPSKKRAKTEYPKHFSFKFLFFRPTTFFRFLLTYFGVEKSRTPILKTLPSDFFQVQNNIYLSTRPSLYATGRHSRDPNSLKIRIFSKKKPFDRR